MLFRISEFYFGNIATCNKSIDTVSHFVFTHQYLLEKFYFHQSVQQRMEGLPKLPGLDFKNRLKINHHVAHSFDLVNGYRIPRTPPLGIGKDTLNEDSIAYVQKCDSTLYVHFSN